MLTLNHVEDASRNVAFNFDAGGCLDSLGGKTGHRNGKTLLRLLLLSLEVRALRNHVYKVNFGMKMLSKHCGLLEGNVGRRTEVDGQQNLRGYGAECIRFGHYGLLAVPHAWPACFFSLIIIKACSWMMT